MITTKDTEKPHHTHNPFMIATLKKQIMPLVSIIFIYFFFSKYYF